MQATSPQISPIKERKPYQFQPGNPGKPKGTRSKRTLEAQHAIQDAFTYLQRDPKKRLRAWAMENTTAFYTIIWPKILPKNINVTSDGAFPTLIVQALAEIAGRYRAEQVEVIELEQIEGPAIQEQE